MYVSDPMSMKNDYICWIPVRACIARASWLRSLPVAGLMAPTTATNLTKLHRNQSGTSKRARSAGPQKSFCLRNLYSFARILSVIPYGDPRRRYT